MNLPISADDYQIVGKKGEHYLLVKKVDADNPSARGYHLNAATGEISTEQPIQVFVKWLEPIVEYPVNSDDVLPDLLAKIKMIQQPRKQPKER